MSSALHSGLSVELRWSLADPIRTIPGLLQWYAADQETGLTDGTHDTSIPDRSGNGYTLTGATGPQWRSAANGIGGVPAYEFASGREVSASSRVVPLNDFTLFFVYAYISGRVLGLENDTSSAHGLAFYNGSTWIIRQNGASFDLGGSGVTPAVQSLRMGSGRTHILSHLSGVAISGDMGSGGYSDAGVNFTLGSSGNGLSDFSGKIAEFVSFDRRLTTPEFFSIHGFLLGKYGLN